MNSSDSNTNSNGSATIGAGVKQVTSGGITNCIIYNNVGPAGNFTTTGGTIAYSCAPELTDDVDGNTTNNPAFTDAALGDYTLADGSPCLNAGDTGDWTKSDLDLAGNPRVQGGRIDMGAYEAQPPAASVLVIQ